MELTTKFQLRRFTIITLTTTAIICFALALVFQYERNQQSPLNVDIRNRYMAGLAATTTIGFLSLLVVGSLGVTSQQLSSNECVQLYNAGIKRYNEQLQSLQTQSVGLANQATATNQAASMQQSVNKLTPMAVPMAKTAA